jgi:hypothetical protein
MTTWPKLQDKEKYDIKRTLCKRKKTTKNTEKKQEDLKTTTVKIF